VLSIKTYDFSRKKDQIAYATNDSDSTSMKMLILNRTQRNNAFFTKLVMSPLDNIHSFSCIRKKKLSASNVKFFKSLGFMVRNFLISDILNIMDRLRQDSNRKDWDLHVQLVRLHNVRVQRRSKYTHTTKFIHIALRFLYVEGKLTRNRGPGCYRGFIKIIASCSCLMKFDTNSSVEIATEISELSIPRITCRIRH